MTQLQRRREAKLRALGNLGPMVAASLCRRMVKCGRRTCVCAQGEKHASWCLTYKGEGNKTKTVHVPIDLVEEVRGWVEEHKRAKVQLAEISQLSMEIIKSYVSTKRARRKKTGPV